VPRPWPRLLPAAVAAELRRGLRRLAAPSASPVVDRAKSRRCACWAGSGSSLSERSDRPARRWI